MTTIRDILTTSIVAAEQRGYDRALAELQAILNGASTPRPQPPNPTALRAYEARTLETIRQHPGLTGTEIRTHTGYRSISAVYRLIKLGLVRREGDRYAPKGSPSTSPRVRFYPVDPIA